MDKQHTTKNPQSPAQGAKETGAALENASPVGAGSLFLTRDTIFRLHSLVGNQAVQRLLATKIQREPEMTFTLEEALGGEAAINMARDFDVSESTEEIIYINTPGFIQGMGYTSKRMASIYKPLKQIKARVLKSSPYTSYIAARK